MAPRSNTIVDFDTILLSPGSGRAIDENVSWRETGTLGFNVWNEGFAKRIPGVDKCVIDYSCADDWTTPAFFSIPRLAEVELRVITPWPESALPGVTSVTLPRTPWSEDDIVVYKADRSMLPRSAWSISGRVVTIPLDAVNTTFIEYRPRIRAFLTSKGHSKNEWSAKVSWNMQFTER
jgi:hypothetical protein